MGEASSVKFTNFSDSRIEEIVSAIKDLSCSDSELEEEVCPYVAQWLYELGITIESTCLIISSIINIENIQSTIDKVYNGEFPPLPKTHLYGFLGKKKYLSLEKVIEKNITIQSITGELDDNTDVITNFELKQVLQMKTKHYANGNSQELFIPVIEAVPTSLTIYDSPITEQSRTFKTVWESNYSNRKFQVVGESAGASIQEIADYLKNAGFSYNPKLLEVTLACMINSLIDNGFADVKTTIDNRGIYFDRENERLIPVKVEFFKIEPEEMKKCADLLNELATFFEDNEDVFASVIKWSMMSIFSYAMKQAGNWLPYLYLKGSAGSGKTTLAQIGLYLYGTPSSENSMGGSSFNTEYRIGNNISKDCTARVVNEPASVFTRDASRELIKVCVESITCRKVQGKVYPAFSPVAFTANQYLPDDDALLRRMYVISFTHKQRKTEKEKKEFKQKFHVTTPTMSRLKALSTLGKFAIQQMIHDPSKLFDDWQQTANFIISEFYLDMGVQIPYWITTWAETETLDDYDMSQQEEIRDFFVREFNAARRKITFRDENGYISNPHLTSAEDGGLKEVCWGLINERVFAWAIPRHKRGYDMDFVCLTQSFKNTLNKEMNYSNNLKSLAELLGWEYTQVRFKNSNLRVIEVPFDDFIEFVYPTEGRGADEWY